MDYLLDISEIPVRLSNQHKHTGDEKLALLAVYEDCVEPGSKSAFCRKYGIDTKTARLWAAQKRDGLLVPTDARKNRYMLTKRERLDYVRLQRENEKLKHDLAQSESAVEVLGKASELLAALAKSSQLQSPPTPDPAPPIPDTFRARTSASDSTP